MPLRFRNIDVSPDAAVEEWGFEGILTAIDRGTLTDWRRIQRAVDADPWGAVAIDLEDALDAAEDRGAAAALRHALARSRDRRESAERSAVAEELRDLQAQSGLTQGEFARHLGTSRSRLNTYLNGRVTPAATVLVRARAVVDNRRHRATRRAG
jgi:DNA-binding transcriptional regulator YiaG